MNAICSAMRSAPADSYDELREVLACFAAMVGRPMNELSDKATSVAVDLLDEIVGQIEQDQIEQQREVAWADREDVPGFGGTYEQLGALSVWSSALSQISGRPA
jgi:hypothetical protein